MRERNITKDELIDTIKNSLLTACRNHFGTADNCEVRIDEDSFEYKILQHKEVVNEVLEPVFEISLPDALMIDKKAKVGESVEIPVDPADFGRISAQNAKGVVVQKVHEAERNSLYRDYFEKEHGIMRGQISRFMGANASINLGKADAILPESEQIKGESLKVGQRIVVYLTEVKNSAKGPRISVSRTHPDLIRCLFEEEVTEIKDGTVEIKSIAREPGSRTKMAVVSYNENVDPVGACVGVNGNRVNSIVDELGGEKIDIINWDDNAAFLIENALSPSKVICVVADEETNEAVVIVPDNQLSLAIGKEGQNARLAAKLTGFKIDIKSESDAEESGLLEELGMEAMDDDEEMYDEEGAVDEEAGDEEAQVNEETGDEE